MRSVTDDYEDEIGVPCGYLACGKVIVQVVGRGRRKEFCSETCRRAADRDFKRARSRAELYEEQLRRSQHHAAAYGRKGGDTVTPEQTAQFESRARVALAKAEMAIELGADPVRTRELLENLVAAVRPLLGESDRTAARLA